MAIGGIELFPPLKCANWVPVALTWLYYQYIFSNALFRIYLVLGAQSKDLVFEPVSSHLVPLCCTQSCETAG